jgi:hypothetical protein
MELHNEELENSIEAYTFNQSYFICAALVTLQIQSRYLSVFYVSCNCDSPDLAMACETRSRICSVALNSERYTPALRISLNDAVAWNIVRRRRTPGNWSLLLYLLLKLLSQRAIFT